MKRCFFIGHRDAREDIIPQLIDRIEHHIIVHRVEEFVVGYYGSFDRIVCSVLAKMKQSYPHIHLTLLTPYHPAVRRIAVPPDFDGILYPSFDKPIPQRYAVIHANQYIVDHSHYLIAYAPHPQGNAAKIVAYAQRRSHIHVSVIV